MYNHWPYCRAPFSADGLIQKHLIRNFDSLSTLTTRVIFTSKGRQDIFGYNQLLKREIWMNFWGLTWLLFQKIQMIANVSADISNTLILLKEALGSSPRYVLLIFLAFLILISLPYARCSILSIYWRSSYTSRIEIIRTIDLF